MSATDMPGVRSDAPATELESSEPGARKMKLKRATEALRGRARRYADTAQERAEALQARTREAVRESPVTVIGSTVGAALLAGVLVGFFIGQAMSTRR